MQQANTIVWMEKKFWTLPFTGCSQSTGYHPPPKRKSTKKTGPNLTGVAAVATDAERDEVLAESGMEQLASTSGNLWRVFLQQQQPKLKHFKCWNSYFCCRHKAQLVGCWNRHTLELCRKIPPAAVPRERQYDEATNFGQDHCPAE